MFLAAENISFGYDPDRPVLQNACLKIEDGHRLHLSGTNGCGKTTLFNILLGLLQPWSGNIVFNNQQCRRETDFCEVRKSVGLLFQDSDDQLFCPTVFNDVAFGPLNLGLSEDAARERAATTLAELELTALANRIPHRLSAGEKRLAALAGVLAMQPTILLLDEPTAGLDQHARNHLVDVLEQSRCGLLVASHDLEFAERITNQRLELRDGRVIDA